MSPDKSPKPKRNMLKLIYRIGDDDEKEIERPIERISSWEEFMDVNGKIARATGASVFFPTFRRIEGGFSIPTRGNDEVIRYMDSGIIRTTNRAFVTSQSNVAIQLAMNELSERVSVGSHRFVTSISTDDINRLVTSKYAEISEKNNKLQMDFSAFILTQVGDEFGRGTGSVIPDPEATLSEIRSRAQRVTQESQSLLRPFTVLSDLIMRIFQYKGIKLAGPVTLGEAKRAITSDLLSAGEKQMLSFLCYNAFAKQSCIFIDEPEISLHVDWQRIIFPILMEQATGNQFIVATHSPFIYSKYADRELLLESDRGDSHANASDD